MHNASRAVSALLLLTLLSADRSFAGFEKRHAGARSLGIAGTLSCFGEGSWSFICNPARAEKAAEVGVYFVPSVLGLQEVKATGMAYRGSIFGADCSAAAQTFGFDLYRESVFSLGVSMPATDFLFVGTNLNLNHLFIRDYGSDAAASIDAGARMFLSDNFALGLATTNLNSASMTNSGDRLPQAFSGGIGYISNPLNVGFEYYKEIGFPAALRVAVEYSPVRFITFRTGSMSGTNSFNAGVTLRIIRFEVEYGAMFHQILGLTQSFGVSVNLSGNPYSEYEAIQKYRESLRRK